MTQNEVIKSTSYNQHEILYNIMKLYNNSEPFDCDMTYSKGNFYGNFKINKNDNEIVEFEIPSPKYKFDVYPQTEDTIKIEPLKPLPLEDGSIGSMVYDPPFVIAPKECKSMKDPKKGSNLIQKRFSSFYPLTELFETYYFHLTEFKRVLKNDGIVVFKCQDTISARKQICTPSFVWFLCECLGLTVIDKFVLNSKNRLISGKHTKQEHSRRYESYFLVIKNTVKNKPKYLSFMTSETYNELINNFIKNNI